MTVILATLSLFAGVLFVITLIASLATMLIFTISLLVDWWDDPDANTLVYWLDKRWIKIRVMAKRIK